MHFSSAESNLIDFRDDEVTENSNGFAIFSIDQKLATACVLVRCNDWPSDTFGHLYKTLLHDIDACRLNRMRVPKVNHIDNKLTINFLE